MNTTLILPQRKISLPVQATGLIFFGILFYISRKFYLERILFIDDAFYFFRIMEKEGFITNFNRYGDYIPQLLPLLALKLKCSLRTIIIAYSVSFIVLHYFIFLFITLVLKNNGAGIAVMLASCLFYYHAFYFPLCQFGDSVIAAVMLWAFIHPEAPYTSAKQNFFYTTGAIATIVYMSFLHPLGIVPILFVIGMEMIGSKRYRDRSLWIILGLGGGWFLIKSWVLFSTGYDSDRIMPVAEIAKQLPSLRHWSSTQYLDTLTWEHFKVLKWILIFLIILSLRKGILFFVFVSGAILLFTLEYLVTCYRWDISAHLESYYCMYGFFLAMLYVVLLYHPRRRNVVLLLSLPLMFLGISRIYEAHGFFTQRVAYLNRLIKDAHGAGAKKCLVDDRCYPYQYATAAWGVAFETLIYSSLPGPDSTVTVFIKTPEFNKMCDSVKNKPNVMFGVHFCPLWYSSNDMPDEYFKLPSSGYTYLTHEQTDTSFHENNFSAENVTIAPLVKSVDVKSNNNMTVIPLQIINHSGKVIPSIPDTNKAVRLLYCLYNKEGRLMDSRRENLETDAGAVSEQGILVYYPGQKGSYSVHIDLETSKHRQWKINTRPVIINVE